MACDADGPTSSRCRRRPAGLGRFMEVPDDCHTRLDNGYFASGALQVIVDLRRQSHRRKRDHSGQAAPHRVPEQAAPRRWPFRAGRSSTPAHRSRIAIDRSASIRELSRYLPTAVLRWAALPTTSSAILCGDAPPHRAPPLWSSPSRSEAVRGLRPCELERGAVLGSPQFCRAARCGRARVESGARARILFQIGTT